ncbi:MAG: drug:proton antiporter, partial [Bacteroidota bacterium]|nr:drug:proton antiporter [Bacteroidota bacterium]
ISLLGIPREKMAQASGITNTVRQLGGSFGVAILTTILTARITYHTQMYGEALNPNSQVYQNVQTNLGYHIQQSSGKSKVSAASLGKSVIVAQANKEAYIQAINDDFTIAAVATILGGLPVLLLRTKKKQLYSKSVKK